MKQPLFYTRGVISLELIFGVVLVVLVITFSVHALTTFLTTGEDIADKTAALYLAEDGLELVRFIRDDDWADISGLTNGSTYYLAVTASAVSLTGTPTTTGQYTRTIVVQPVYRDANDDVVTSGGSADADSKIVTVTVTWDGGAESVTLSTIVGDISAL